MSCRPLKIGDVTGVVCARGRQKKSTQKCGVLVDGKPCGESSELLCDGCDVILCNPHRVAAARGGERLDFCPKCFAPVFKAWLKTLPAPLLTNQYERRLLFRQWARVNPEAFHSIPLSPLAPGQTRESAAPPRSTTEVPDGS